MNLATKLLEPNTDLAALMTELFERLPNTLADDGDVDPGLWNEALLDPALDILRRSGKGLRAGLLERCWQLADGDPEGPPEMLPVLIELLHVGSLIIDDIEDDSSTRRGEPALHRRYGVPIALNTGNWFYFLPLALLSRLDLDPRVRLAFYEDASLALLRCHQGQALDLSVKVVSVRQQELPQVVARATRLKTGSLMELAAVLGARAAGASEVAVAALRSFGSDLGVGLQMLDDWSAIHVEERRAKGIEDITLARPTWPWAWLAEECDEVTFADMARGAGGVAIEWEADRAMARARTRLGSVPARRIGDHLNGTLEQLRLELGDSVALESMREDVERLERAYG